MKIEEAKFYKIDLYECIECRCKFNYQTANLTINNTRHQLCDDCLQELNRKIVEYLANKNI